MTPDEFGQWVAEYADKAGDAAIATMRLRDLRQMRGYIDMAIGDLEKLIADELPVGVTEMPVGAVTVRRGAETYVYPTAGTDEYKELFNHVVSRLLDQVDSDSPERPERQVALKLFELWPMGPQNVRSTALTKVTGLKLNEYRLSGGRRTSVQIH